MNLYILQLQLINCRTRCKPSIRENRQNGNQEGSQEGTREESTREESRKESREKEVVAVNQQQGNTRGGRYKASPSVFVVKE
jgi:hypothetical protein